MIQLASDAQQQACAWLAEHNGSGCWGHDGVLIAGGERAPIMRSTWNALKSRGWVAFEKGTRVEITEEGRKIAARKPFDVNHYSNFEDEVA